MKIRVYYHDTDAGGIVYYGNYLKFLEEARTEFIERCCASMRDLMAQGVLFVVARQEIDYKHPAYYADILDIDTRVTDIGASKIEFAYEVKNQDNQLICAAKTVMVCVDKDFKPQPIPEHIRKKLL